MPVLRLSLLGCLLALLSASGSSKSADPTAAIRPTDLCSLFSSKEVTQLLGIPVGPGGVAALGTGCQWDSLNDDDPYFAQIQVLADTSYWQDFKLAPKYEAIQGLGIKAYSLPDDEGGWRASALTDRVSIVRLVSGAATRGNTVTFLRRLVQRNQ